MTLQVTGWPIAADALLQAQASACWILDARIQLNTRARGGAPEVVCTMWGEGKEKPLTLPGIEGSLVNTPKKDHGFHHFGFCRTL